MSSEDGEVEFCVPFMYYSTTANVHGRFEEVTEMQFSSIGQYICIMS
jgi:hypothetical protein